MYEYLSYMSKSIVDKNKDLLRGEIRLKLGREFKVYNSIKDKANNKRKWIYYSKNNIKHLTVRYSLRVRNEYDWVDKGRNTQYVVKYI